MENFLQVDYFAHLTQAQIAALKKADDAELKAFYDADTRADYAESFWLDDVQATGLTINEDGTAEGVDGRKLSGRPSFAVFIEYIRKGRQA